MSFLFWNVQGLPNKFTNQRRQIDFTKLLCRYDFIGLSETWLTRDDVESGSFINKFNGYGGIFAARGTALTKEVLRSFIKTSLKMRYS
jgi:hypothetical protein